MIWRAQNPSGLSILQQVYLEMLCGDLPGYISCKGYIPTNVGHIPWQLYLEMPFTAPLILHICQYMIILQVPKLFSTQLSWPFLSSCYHFTCFRPKSGLLSSIHVQLQQTSCGSHSAQSPFMQPRRFGPAFSHHHQDLTPPKSPLTTRHMHSPGAHHHHWVSGDTSSGSAEEKQHKAPPQKKPPMLPLNTLMVPMDISICHRWVMTQNTTACYLTLASTWVFCFVYKSCLTHFSICFSTI